MCDIKESQRRVKHSDDTYCFGLFYRPTGFFFKLHCSHLLLTFMLLFLNMVENALRTPILILFLYLFFKHMYRSTRRCFMC